MHKNGSNKRIVNGGRAQGFDGVGLNIVESSNAEFAELAFWNKSLPKADIDEAEAYLAWKWGLQDSLPNDHPYANRITELNDKNKTYPKRKPKQPVIYNNSSVYKVGDIVNFKGVIYTMVESARGAGYAPDRQGDRLWRRS
jgi:hypothetical protein